MKTLIIEDNEIEAENLKVLLGRFEWGQPIGAVDTIKRGIELANMEHPEIIFLDIQLECQNSLEHMHQLDYTPYVICVTLHTEHALQAFEVGVGDYLTKPITAEKLSRAMKRFFNLRGKPHQDGAEQSIPLNNGTKVTMVPISRIIQITADRDYTVVRDQGNAEFLCSRRMSEWMELLPSADFVSLDRSTIINKKQVDSFSGLGEGRTASILFLNGSTCIIGPAARRRLKLAVSPPI